MGRSDRDKLAIAETPGEGPIQSMLAESARAHAVWLIGGTLPLAVGAPVAVDRVLNANLVFSPRGELAARYDKMHLFAFDNGASATTRRARCSRAGTVAFDAGGLRIGLSVCYDLRFPSSTAR
jgi:nitrilase